MFLRRVTVENCRSFLHFEKLELDGKVTILIGPNGGGKTNLLDAIVVVLRRYLLASMYAAVSPTPEEPSRFEFRQNEVLNNMILEKHTRAKDALQRVEVEVEVTQIDIVNLKSIQNDAEYLTSLAGARYSNHNLNRALGWQLEGLEAGSRLIYALQDGHLQIPGGAGGVFLEYLKLFEINSLLREEFNVSPLSTPLIYLPVNRTSSAFDTSVQLASYNHFEVKRQVDASYSRTTTNIVNLAVGRVAQRYRLLLEEDKGQAAEKLRASPNLQQLTLLLRELGYEWSLYCKDPLKNQYDVQLKKQGSSFLVSAASSGEREILTYLFAIFVLNVRDALIIVDEPELHLHPKWQKTLLRLFVRLAETTGNQFLLATHSPVFISPESIGFVSRVYSQEQESHIVRLDATGLPNKKHLLNIVNSQNNERLFFADKVVLVEGVSDRIFFEALLDFFGRPKKPYVIEVISVGGKGLFDAYAKVLNASNIQYSIIADLDYVEQVGTSELKQLFALNSREIKDDLIDNVKSLDGDALVKAIDRAVGGGGWTDAEGIWTYIKSRRRRLRDDLNEKEKNCLTAFLESKAVEHLYILKCGGLEDYLPVGYASRDMDKLIQLLSSENFWDQLPSDRKSELEVIAASLLAEV